jgi:hypothetical protein
MSSDGVLSTPMLGSAFVRARDRCPGPHQLRIAIMRRSRPRARGGTAEERGRDLTPTRRRRGWVPAGGLAGGCPGGPPGGPWPGGPWPLPCAGLGDTKQAPRSGPPQPVRPQKNAVRDPSAPPTPTPDRARASQLATSASHDRGPSSALTGSTTQPRRRVRGAFAQDDAGTSFTSAPARSVRTTSPASSTPNELIDRPVSSSVIGACGASRPASIAHSVPEQLSENR